MIQMEKLNLKTMLRELKVEKVKEKEKVDKKVVIRVEKVDKKVAKVERVGKRVERVERVEKEENGQLENDSIQNLFLIIYSQSIIEK